MACPTCGPDLLDLASKIEELIKTRYVDSARRAFTAALENHTGKWFEITVSENHHNDFLALDQKDAKFVTREALFHDAKDALKVGEFGVELAFGNEWKFTVLEQELRLVRDNKEADQTRH